MHFFFLVAMLCVASVCIVGVLSCRFKDTLFQRIGMGVTALGAVSSGITRTENGFMCLGFGIAIYSIATAYKLYKGAKNGLA